ncbi:Dolichyl-diphosphooligosaccharide--protein glycosyltransferase subunit WBP1 [Fimicolochytrium jonesii]|uniref:Dolichyl-diphosphooligosaccharide--protein glycosyltransferase subunit WBP1 n=1 Tax=Fimicolochytrium jonesii TaxID=1396493 RepID=UPI0022FDD3F5|nr:Dolichyl-diphosphooligosaccharide--protein glycosyltransferase subunit WBP1 [Fimicolochytrium jonesii]KAI8821030.1 Dolichyl-diphosphooligosaccharide--protein glycosyltransferase subunit WBP1 [Fimicolochytrium jonesii]
MARWELLALWAALVALISTTPSALAKPAFGSRTLVVLEDVAKKDTYGKFLKGLEERGHNLVYKSASESQFNLVAFDELAYDHFLVLAPQVKSLGGELSISHVIDFVNKGGNVLLATSSSITEAVRDVAYEFSADFDDSGTAVIDHFNAVDEDPTLIAASSFPDKNIKAVSAAVRNGGPVLFRGVGHRLTGKNPLMQPILIGAPTTYSYLKDDDEPLEGGPLVGNGLVLVSGLQARNNARVVFAGSVDMFSDEFIDKKVGDRQSGNADFVTELGKWAFQEKGVLKVGGTFHHRLNETAQHGIYRIKDDMVYEIKVAEWTGENWSPFTPSDMQFEAVMLDPYIRTHLRSIPSAPGIPHPYATLATQFRLPDHYGVFTFKVDYKRHGYSWLEAAETVQVRPYRHDQYPRFLTPAYPYYVNVFSMMVGFVLFSAVFLWNREPGTAAGKGAAGASAKSK